MELAKAGKSVAAGNVGVFMPKCASNGDWSLAQCSAATGYCWCSTPGGQEQFEIVYDSFRIDNFDKYQKKSDFTRMSSPHPRKKRRHKRFPEKLKNIYIYLEDTGNFKLSDLEIR